MSAPTGEVGPGRSAEAPPTSWDRPTGGTPTWRVSRHGVGTVAWLELRRLMRARRWLVAWAAWTTLVTGLCGLVVLSTVTLGGAITAGTGTVLFGVTVLVVLSFGLLVAPGLAATSINGDSRDGTLATLQVTLLSPAEIAVGKLLAAWCGTLALLAGALPSLVVAFALGGTSLTRLLVIVLLVGVSLAVVTAVGLGLSAVVVRPVASVVLSYLVAFCLAVVSPLLVPLSSALLTTTETVTYVEPAGYDPDTGRPTDCVERRSQESLPRTDLTWWLLVTSPYVVVADAAPLQPDLDPASGSDVLRGLGDVSREARLGPDLSVDWCSELDDRARAAERAALPPVWPWGLAFYAVLVAGSTALAVRRLRTPVGRLPVGQRIA
ncbi:ABC transporter permease [Aquipuribacter sp. MA13-6]|uniref:ABC transporter permease n=1 Tax=unclassified Aquipuribacter TaxID=2635084 RepID=UPI003EE92CAB